MIKILIFLVITVETQSWQWLLFFKLVNIYVFCSESLQIAFEQVGNDAVNCAARSLTQVFPNDLNANPIFSLFYSDLNVFFVNKFQGRTFLVSFKANKRIQSVNIIQKVCNFIHSESLSE